MFVALQHPDDPRDDAAGLHRPIVLVGDGSSAGARELGENVQLIAVGPAWLARYC
jgi:hypothetical protein